MMINVLIGLGGNTNSSAGNPKDTIAQALVALSRAGLQIAAISRFYCSPAFPAGSGPDFVNACAVAKTNLSPHDTLALLHAVEAQFGRVRTSRWAARTLDIDLLAHGDSILPNVATEARWRELPPDRQRTETPDTLILPHPRLADRAFVLLPLREIAASWRHPVTGRTVSEMAAALRDDDKQGIVPLNGPTLRLSSDLQAHR